MATFTQTRGNFNPKALLWPFAILVTAITLVVLGPKAEDALENFSLPVLPDKNAPTRNVENEITHSNTYQTSMNGVTLEEEFTDNGTKYTISDESNYVEILNTKPISTSSKRAKCQ